MFYFPNFVSLSADKKFIQTQVTRPPEFKKIAINSGIVLYFDFLPFH